MTNITRNLLVIDDNLADYLLLEYAIKSGDNEYQITWIDEGEKAFQYINNFTSTTKPQLPSLVFMDINLPGVNGMELLQLLKSKDETKLVPVIMVSHSQVPKEIASLTGCGADLFLYKEMNLDIFTQKIQEILENY